MADKVLVMLPTYNEKENVKKMCTMIRDQGITADILFIDDNSPDGTGDLLDSMSKEISGLFVLHRAGKLGIGSAHTDGIHWAYSHKYTHLVTMDSDFTHSPENIKDFLKYGNDYQIVVGSRFKLKNSLEGWNMWRKFMTHTGHALTRVLLKVPYDATGAFRLYRIDQIPEEVFEFVKSRGYSFFFESLGILHLNKFSIQEVPIVLPPRTYGHSKLRFRDMVQCLLFMIELGFTIRLQPKTITLQKSTDVEKNKNLSSRSLL